MCPKTALWGFLCGPQNTKALQLEDGLEGVASAKPRQPVPVVCAQGFTQPAGPRKSGSGLWGSTSYSGKSKYRNTSLGAFKLWPRQAPPSIPGHCHEYPTHRSPDKLILLPAPSTLCMWYSLCLVCLHLPSGDSPRRPDHALFHPPQTNADQAGNTKALPPFIIRKKPTAAPAAPPLTGKARGKH